MTATDHHSAHKATTDLSLRLAYLREIVLGNLYPSELAGWLMEAKTEETCESGGARRLIEPWLDALAAARGGCLFQDGELTGASAAAALLQLYDRSRLLTTVALSDAFGPRDCTLWLGHLAGQMFRPEDQGITFWQPGQKRCLDLLALSAGTGTHTCRLYLGFLTSGRFADLLDSDVQRCRSMYTWWLELTRNSPDVLRIKDKEETLDRLGLLQTLMRDYRSDIVGTEVDFEFAALGRTSECGHNGSKDAIATKPKRSTEKGEARRKIIAALTEHHKYDKGGCLNQSPIGGNVLATKAGVTKASTSNFFKAEFGSHAKYRHVCQNVTALVGALKLVRGEFPVQAIIDPSSVDMVGANGRYN